MRQALLHALGENTQSPNHKFFLKDVCTCISAIATIEVPTQQWADFVGVMTEQGNQSENFYFKLAAIQILGFFMEKLNPRDIQDDEVNMIWNTMLSNIVQDNLELTSIVANAVARLAPATVKNFQNQAQQERIMEGIFNLLKVEDLDVKRKTMESLLDIIKLNYSHIAPYLDTLFFVTEAYMLNTDEEKIA
jgi:hypothetical protein